LLACCGHDQRGSRQPYVRTLPEPGACNSLDTWEEAEMVLLPTVLREASLERRQWTAQVHRESVAGKARLFGGREVSLTEFVHFTCLVASRTLGVANSNGGKKTVCFSHLYIKMLI
jgi:hypothetical protein